MIKLLVERDRPPTFNPADDKEAARHARISVNAIAELAGRYHLLCTYATEEKLFSVIVVDDETVYDEWVKKTNAYTVGLKVRRIVRVLDPSAGGIGTRGPPRMADAAVEGSLRLLTAASGTYAT